MNHCSNCNTDCEGNFCPSCGAPTAPATATAPAPPAGPQASGFHPYVPDHPAPGAAPIPGPQAPQPQQTAPQPPPVQQYQAAQPVPPSPQPVYQTVNTAQPQQVQMMSAKSRLVAVLLCFFLGALGIHRFYVGKVGTGILYIFTVGLFGIGVLVDFIMILVGSFTDKSGLPVVQW